MAETILSHGAFDENGKPLSAVAKRYAGHDFMPEMRKGLNKWAVFLQSKGSRRGV
jgi:hypothetical protein